MKKGIVTIHTNRIEESPSVRSSACQFHASLNNPRILQYLSILNPPKSSPQKHRLSPHYRRKNYKRGQNIERQYYRQLNKQLIEFQEYGEKIRTMNVKELFLYRQEYVNQFLGVLADRLIQQCQQKSVFLTRLWRNVIHMFQNLLDRLIIEIRQNQKASLKDSVNVHRSYLKKIEQLTVQNIQQDQKVKSYQHHFKGLTKQYKEKKKKNKELADLLIRANESILENENKVEIMKKQFVELMKKVQNINSEDAKDYLNEKFKVINKNDELSRNHLYEFKRAHREKTKKQEKEILSDFDILVETSGKQESEKENSPPEPSPPQEKKKNYRVQVDLNFKKKVREDETNFSSLEHYEDGLIRNKQIQTTPVFFQNFSNRKHQATQYYLESIVSRDNSNSLPTFDSNENDKAYRLTLSNYKSDTKKSSNIKDQSIKDFSSSESFKQQEHYSYHQQSKGKNNKTKKKQGKQPNYMKNTNQFKQTLNSSTKRPQNSTINSQNGVESIGIGRNSVSKKTSRMEESQKSLNSTHVQKMQTNKTILKEDCDQSQKMKRKGWHKTVQSMEKAKNLEQVSQIHEKERVKQKKNSFDYEVFLAELRQCPVGCYLDQTVALLLNASSGSQLRKKGDYDEHMIAKNGQLTQKLHSSKKMSRSSQYCLPLRSITRIIGKVYDRAFSSIKNSKPLNMIQHLKEQLREDHPSLKDGQIDNKILMLTKNLQVYQISNFLVKNFMLIACMVSKPETEVMFASDVEFYFGLIKKLNILENFHIERSYTTTERLFDVLKSYIAGIYPSQILLHHVEVQLTEKLQEKLQCSESLKLDIYKCCQLILECILGYKLKYLESLKGVVEALCEKKAISEGFFRSMLDFMSLGKVKYLQIVNRFRQLLGKKTTIGMIQLMNFSIKQGLPDFDSTVYYSEQLYPVSLPIPRFSQLYNAKKSQINEIAQAAYEGKLQIPGEKSCLALNNLVQRQCCKVLECMLGDSLLNLYVWTTCQLDKMKI